MSSIKVFQVDSFTTTPFFGNPAGVVLQAEALSVADRQNVALEMNCSETAFVEQTGPTSFSFRYYTPQTEVDLCGHATIAALHTIYQETGLSGNIHVDTNVGVLPMRIQDDGTVFMRQATPAFRQLSEEQKADVLKALRVGEDVLSDDLPFALAYTGLWDIMVPFALRDDVMSLSPDMDALKRISESVGAASVHVYTFDVVDSASTLHARDFSPAVGVPEDPHTGTANGALGALLVNQGRLAPGQFVFEQGWSVGRPGHIFVEVTKDAEVFVGGKAVTTVVGDMRLR